MEESDKEKTTADLLHERKTIRRKLAEYRETYIEMKKRIRELEAKENLLTDELDRRGQ
jgi:hypothetical protein